jgi:hypothetical protein
MEVVNSFKTVPEFIPDCTRSHPIRQYCVAVRYRDDLRIHITNSNLRNPEMRQATHHVCHCVVSVVSCVCVYMRVGPQRGEMDSGQVTRGDPHPIVTVI